MGHQMMDEIAADKAGATGYEYAGGYVLPGLVRIHGAAILINWRGAQLYVIARSPGGLGCSAFRRQANESRRKAGFQQTPQGVLL